MPTTKNFADPSWEPCDAELNDRLEEFRRVVIWRRAMADRGIKVLAQGLTAAEELSAMREWWVNEGAAVQPARQVAKAHG